MYSVAEVFTSLPLSETHPNEWDEFQQFLTEATTSLILVSDFDEVIVNSVIMHWLLTYAWLKKYDFMDRRLSYYELCKEGWTSVWDDLFGYIEFNRKLRNSEYFHRILPPMPDVKELKKVGESLAFYLTTRPQVLTNLTSQSI